MLDVDEDDAGDQQQDDSEDEQHHDILGDPKNHKNDPRNEENQINESSHVTLLRCNYTYRSKYILISIDK